MRWVQRLIDQVANTASLDRIATPVTGVVGRVVKPRLVRNVLSGTYIGHPLHPMLTDAPIGAWGAAALLDTIGGRAGERAADLLIAAGVVAAVPTAAAGLNDWSDTQGAETRIGLVHSAAIHVTLAAYLASLLARARGRRVAGKALALVGLSTLTAGAYLGGHLSFVKGTNVNRAAWLEPTEEWTAVLGEKDLVDQTPRRVQAGDVPILLYREGGTINALSAVCTHMGGPLDEGSVTGGCVTCPWHGSVFQLADGSIIRGPACNPQPRYDTRIQDGTIQVRSHRSAADTGES